MTKYDFQDGHGSVEAHQHPNGGGWVADSAFVHSTAWAGAGVRIGPGAYVGAKVWLGNDTRVGTGAHICQFAYIGHHAAIGPGAYIGDRANISPRAYVRPGAVVSADEYIVTGAEKELASERTDAAPLSEYRGDDPDSSYLYTYYDFLEALRNSEDELKVAERRRISAERREEALRLRLREMGEGR